MYSIELRAFFFQQYRYVYLYEDLGTSDYIRSRLYQTFFKIGSLSDISKPIARYAWKRSHSCQLTSSTSYRTPQSQAIRDMWTASDVRDILTNSENPMHFFAQLCIEHTVMAPADYTGNLFEFMKQEVLRKFKASLSDGKAVHIWSAKGQLDDHGSDITALKARICDLDALSANAPEKLQLCCMIVDSLLRRHPVHS